MDQVNCLRAIRHLIVDNEALLLAGSYHQGSYRVIRDVALSAMNAPRGFYYFLVQIDSVDSQSFSNRSNIRNQRESCYYNCTVHVVDAAVMQPDEYMPFEQTTVDFRAIVDRFVSVLRETHCVTYPGTSNKFNLVHGAPDRTVRVSNLDHTWEDAASQQVGAVLYSQVRFQLEERWA